MKKQFYSSLFLLFLFALNSCSTNSKNEQESEKKIGKTYNDTVLFNPIYLGHLLESPSNSGSIWNENIISSNQITLVNIYSKVLFGPRNLMEKFVYTFYENGKEKEFSHYLYKKSTAPITHIQFSYPSAVQEQLTLNNYLNNGAHPPVFFSISDSVTIQLNILGSNAADSIYYYPNHSNPRLVVKKKGSIIESAHIYSNEKYNTARFKNELKQLDSTLKQFELADKFFTRMENGLPIETHFLDENWQKGEKHQFWDYNAKKQVIYYEENVLGNRTKEIQLTYEENNLPATVVFNRQKMYFHFKFKDVK